MTKSTDKPDLFRDILHSILRTKDDRFDESVYAPYVINRALSYHEDCIMYANQMNMNAHIFKRPQYIFLLNMIRSRKRNFAPWQKQNVPENLQVIATYFNYSFDKARQVESLFTPQDILEMKQKLEQGGKK